MRGDTGQMLKDIGELRHELDVPESNWPALIRFRDIRDPSTVELVAELLLVS